MITTSEKVTHKSITRPTLSVHHVSFLWAWCHELVRSTTRASERAEAPSTDEQAIQMVAGTKDSAEFIKHYGELRRSGTPIEQALVLVGHEVRLRQPEYQLVFR